MTKRSTTLRGTGWLREAPANLVPLEWLRIQGRSALRKCLFLPAPRGDVFGPYRTDHEPRAADTIRDEAPPTLKRRPSTPRDERRGPRRPDTFRRAGMFPAYRTPPSRDLARGAAQRAQRAAASSSSSSPSYVEPWWDSPIVLGLMLIFLPPAGLAAVWSRPGYDRDAKWALTIATLLFMALATVFAVAVLRH